MKVGPWGGRFMSPRRGLPVAALILAGCGSSGTRRADTEPDLDALPKLTVTQDLRVGSVDDPDIGFSRMGAVTVGPEGLVYVAESQDKEIRVFDGQGTPVRTIGRQGEGPGEFQGLGDIGFKGDTLWVNDPMAARITLFDPDGGVIGTLPATGVWLGSQEDGYVLEQPGSLRDDGRVDFVVPGIRFSPGGPDTLSFPELVFDRNGQVVDTAGGGVLGPFAGGTVSLDGHELRAPAPPSDRPLRTRVHDGLVVVEGPAAVQAGPATLTVTRIDLVGDTVYSRRFGYMPRPFESAFIDALVGPAAIRATRMTGLDSSTVARTLRGGLHLPPFAAPVSQALVGADGSVWLRRDDDGGPTFRWVVLAPDGSPVGQFQLPRSVDVRWASLGSFFGADRDDAEIPWLVRYHLE